MRLCEHQVLYVPTALLPSKHLFTNTTMWKDTFSRPSNSPSSSVHENANKDFIPKRLQVILPESFFFLLKPLRTPPFDSFLKKLKPRTGLNILFYVHSVRQNLALPLQNSDSPKLITQMSRGEKKKCGRDFPPSWNALSFTLDVSFLLVLSFVPLGIQEEENFLKWEELLGSQPH